MRILIVYFSATGNTEYGAGLIKKGVESSGGDACDLVNVRDFHNGLPAGYDLLGFACPVFGFKPALPVLDLVRQLHHGDGKPCFTFFTMGGYACNAPWMLACILKQKGYTVIANKEMVCEDSWTTARFQKRNMGEHPTTAEQESVREFGASLKETWLSYCNGSPQDGIRFRLNPLHLISFFYNRPLLSWTFTVKVNTNTCTRCGICEEKCPTGRMRRESFPRPKGSCVGCYGCINNCSEEAVDGWLTKGKIRYKGIKESLKTWGQV